LLNGINPYSGTYSEVYPGIVTAYGYGPLTILLELPFIAVFRDPRMLLIISDILCGFLIYLIGKRSYFAEIMTLIFLFRPNSLFITEQSFIINLETLLIFLFIYFWSTARTKMNAVLSGSVLGCLLSVKFLYLIHLPLYVIVSGRNKIKQMVAGFSFTFLLIVVPFALWNFHDLYINTFAGWLAPPSQEMKSIPYSNSLSLNAISLFITGGNIPTVLFFIVFLSIYIAISFRLFRLRKESEERKISYTVLGLVIITLSFYMLFKASFINQYYSISSLIVVWLVLLNRFRLI